MKITSTLAAVAALFGAVAIPPAWAADSLFNWTNLDGVKIYHAYSASDGHTYIEEISIPAAKRMVGGGQASEYLHVKPQDIVIARGTAGPLASWHYAGDSRHLIIPLQEELVFDTGDGTLHHLKPGEAILAEDWTGKGHRSGCYSQTKPTCVVIDILLDPNPKAMPLRPPPTQ
jgi:hypothetical protein